MSLKGFHLFFIILATLLCAGVAWWALVWEDSPSLGLKVFGGSSTLASIVLPIYGIRFYRKAQQID